MSALAGYITSPTAGINMGILHTRDDQQALHILQDAVRVIMMLLCIKCHTFTQSQEQAISQCPILENCRNAFKIRKK